MKISTNIIKKFQDGGAAPSGAPADPTQGGAGAPPAGGDPAQGGGQDPVQQLIQLAQQALQGQDCQAAMAVCDGLLSVVQQGAGGQPGGDPSQGGAPGGAPAPDGGGQPVYRRGGILVRTIKK